MRLSSDGLTLSELIITTFIVSIMIVGIMSTDFAIRRMDRDSHRDTALSMQMLALAENFRQSALSANGDKNDPGILIDNSSTNANYICFRHDIKPPGTPTPNDYTDDNFECFSRLNDDGSSVGVNVKACQRTAAAGAGACVSTDRYIGRVVTDAFTNNPPIIEPSFDLTTGIFHVQLIGRVDPSAGADTTNWPNGSDDNPQVVIQLDIYAESHSYN